MYNLYQYSPLFCYQFGLLVSMYIDATYSTIGRKKYFFCLSIYSYYSLSFKVGESIFCHFAGNLVCTSSPWEQANT